MLKATRQYKQLVTNILTPSFATNNGVNYIVQQDKFGNEHARICLTM